MSHYEPKRVNHNGDQADTMPEVMLKPQRRQYSAAYKLRILQEYETCAEAGAKGALLRREGLYSSHITSWRRQREHDALAGLSAKRRGPKVDAQAVALAKLQRENARLCQRLQRAELIIEVQKKVSELLGLPMAETDADGRG